MGLKRSAISWLNLEIYVHFFVWFVLVSAARNSLGDTNPADGKSGLDRFLSFFVLFFFFF